MCAMLPRLVGGAELSFTASPAAPRLATFHDQLPKVLSAGAPPLVNDVGGPGLAGRDGGCDAPWSE